MFEIFGLPKYLFSEFEKVKWKLLNLFKFLGLLAVQFLNVFHRSLHGMIFSIVYFEIVRQPITLISMFVEMQIQAAYYAGFTHLQFSLSVQSSVVYRAYISYRSTERTYVSYILYTQTKTKTLKNGHGFQGSVFVKKEFLTRY